MHVETDFLTALAKDDDVWIHLGIDHAPLDITHSDRVPTTRCSPEPNPAEECWRPLDQDLGTVCSGRLTVFVMLLSPHATTSGFQASLRIYVCSIDPHVNTVVSDVPACLGEYMKAVILSGGTGSRLRPITHTVPKQLLPLANKPVLDYVIEDLKSAGIREIGVVLGGDHPNQIQSYLGKGDDHDVEITYIMQGEPRGLAHAVGCAEDFVGDSPFVVYLGDTLVNCGLTKQLVESFDSGSHDISLTLQTVENPSRYGVASFENDDLVAVQEKPEEPPSNSVYVGVLVLTPKAFDIIATQTPSWRGELELTETVDKIVKNGTGVSWTTYEGLWIDVGTPSDAIDANKEMLELNVAGPDNSEDIIFGNKTEIAESAEINGPVVIGDNVTLGRNASIGPYTSIGDGAQISGTEIESSIVMEGCSIDCEYPIKECIIGPRTELKQSSTGELRGVLGQDTNLSL